MRGRSISLPTLDLDCDYGAVIAVKDVSLSPLRRSLVYTADKIDENMGILKSIVYSYNGCGKILMCLIGLLGFISLFFRMIGGVI